MEESSKRTPLTVLMTTDTIGGVWCYSMELCHALQPFNVYFYLVTTGAPMSPAQKQEVSKLQNVTVYETDFLLEWMEAPWQSINESGAWMLQLAEQLQPHLIHLNAYAYGFLPWKVPVVTVAHSDVFSWWLAVKKTAPPKHWNEYFYRVQRSFQNSDIVIAPSNAMMNEVRRIYSITAPHKVIYNGRSDKVFQPAQKQPFICSVGRIWDEAKNIRLLVEAAGQIPYEIKLAGDTSFENDSCTMSAANITSLGKLPAREIAAQLSAAAVYVLPAKYEPFGLSVLEAALSGCALVLGKINSLREIWGDSAMFVDTDNAGALSKTISYLMENKEARAGYGQKAKYHAEKYTTIAMAAKYLQVYDNLRQSKDQPVQQKYF